MLILVALLAAIVIGWMVIGPRILPPAAPAAGETGLEGRWTLTPDVPLATTLDVSAAGYRLEGDLEFTGSGRATRAGEELVVSDDAACSGAAGRYRVTLADVDRFGLLPENRAQTLTLTVVDDPCGARARVLAGTWTLRASGRDGVHGICDPPNEEAAITGHWPEPSGCAGEG